MKSSIVRAPKFPKLQIEGWVVLLSQDKKDRVIAMKRLISSSRMDLSLKLEIDQDLEGEHDFDIHVLSDSYLGVDFSYILRTYISK